MGYNKSYFVTMALEKIGYANYIYDLMPEQLDSALRQLDAMIGTWNAKGIRLGYPLPSSPNISSLDDPTNVPDSANETIYCNLAIRIAPGLGKVVPPETKQVAKEGYDALLVQLAQPLPERYPTTMPLGAGNKPWRWTQGPFVQRPAQQVNSGNDGDIGGWITGNNINWN